MKTELDRLEMLAFERDEQESGFLKTPCKCKKSNNEKEFLSSGEVLASSEKECISETKSKIRWGNLARKDKTIEMKFGMLFLT